jgi:hypothetical protein
MEKASRVYSSGFRDGTTASSEWFLNSKVNYLMQGPNRGKSEKN